MYGLTYHTNINCPIDPNSPKCSTSADCGTCIDDIEAAEATAWQKRLARRYVNEPGLARMQNSALAYGFVVA